MKLKPEEKQLLCRLRAERVLVDIDPKRIDVRNGVIALFCSDGDQKEDLDGHLAELCREQQQGKAREHVLALNGGAILLSGIWQYREEAVVIRRHLEQAVALKGIKTVALYGHWPCGAAGVMQYPILKVIACLMEAKAKVKRMFDGDVRVVPFFHVDWAEEKERKRTYFLSVEEWCEFVARNLCDQPVATETTGDSEAVVLPSQQPEQAAA